MVPDPIPLLAVPNVSEGRDRALIDAIASSFTAGERTRLLDVHVDPDHHRAVLTLVGAGTLANALVTGTRAAMSQVDVMSDPAGSRGAHPHVGAVDVLPVVYLDPRDEGCGVRRGPCCG